MSDYKGKYQLEDKTENEKYLTWRNNLQCEDFGSGYYFNVKRENGMTFNNSGNEEWIADDEILDYYMNNIKK